MPRAGETTGGSLYVISAPSGAGKTSLVAALQSSRPGLHVSISHTTRGRRDGEADGVDYHFVSEEDFLAMIAADAFLEHAQVFDHRYGTARDSVETYLAAGDDVILEIDWQGASQVRQRHPGCIGIFILPPSRKSLAERLSGRGQDSEEVIARRMADAVAEISHWTEFDYLVVNDSFDMALADLHSIIHSGRLVRQRQSVAHGELIASLLV